MFSIIVHEEYISHRTVSLLRNYCRFCFIGGSLKLVIYLTFKRGLNYFVLGPYSGMVTYFLLSSNGFQDKFNRMGPKF